jgi:hypothetical protein
MPEADAQWVAWDASQAYLSLFWQCRSAFVQILRILLAFVRSGQVDCGRIDESGFGSFSLIVLLGLWANRELSRKQFTVD